MLRNSSAGRQPGGAEPLAHPLSFVRAERGWTYQDLVEVVARRVGNMSARREKAWRWEHRGVVPDRETQEALAEELGVPQDVVNALGWPAWLPVGDRGGIAAPWTPDGCLTALDATAGSALVDRRGFLLSDEGSAAATAAQWLALSPAGPPPRPRETTPGAVPPSAAPDDEPVTHTGPPRSRPPAHSPTPPDPTGPYGHAGRPEAAAPTPGPGTPEPSAGPAGTAIGASGAAGTTASASGPDVTAATAPETATGAPETATTPPGTGTGGLAVAAAAEAGAPVGGAATGKAQVVGAMADGLEGRLPHLRAVEHALGGGRVRSLADAELRMVTDLLLSEGPWAWSEPTVRRLFAVAAELARLAGWASLDTGYQAAAERYMTVALSAAHAAGDRLLGANVLRCLSVQYLDAGRPHDALALARAARQGVPRDAPARVAAMLAMQEAQIHAALGAADEYDALIDQADAAMARVDDPAGTPDWAADFDEAELRTQTAVCHALLHRYAHADRQLTRALILHPAERARDRAMYLVRHAEVALRAGDSERGHRLAVEAASWAAGVESLRIRRRLGTLHQQLRRHHGTSSARDEVEGRARSLSA